MGTYRVPGHAGWFGSAQRTVSYLKAGRGRGLPVAAEDAVGLQGMLSEED